MRLKMSGYRNILQSYYDNQVLNYEKMDQALNYGKSPVSFPDLLKYYENSGIMINDLFGTDSQAICNYFEQQDDYSADIYLDVEDFINKQKQYDVYIFTYYNQKDDITKQIHTVAVTKENGKHVAHNVGSIDSADSFETIVKEMEKIKKENFCYWNR